MKLTQKNIVRFIFYPLQISVIVLIAVNAFFIFSKDFQTSSILRQNFYSYGMILGLIAFVFFIFTLTPGILARFGLKNKLILWLTAFRRELGKLMFLFAFAHYLTIKVLPGISMNIVPDFPIYQTIGFIALNLTFLLFITSTNRAQKKLGLWWKRLHRLVYITVWIIFLHVALAQGFTIISALVFLLAFLETMSLANYYFFRLNLD